jgi:hypothetical protein
VTFLAAYEPPWLARVAEIESTSAASIDAERKLLKLGEDMRDLVREIRTKVRTRCCLPEVDECGIVDAGVIFCLNANRTRRSRRARSRSSLWRSVWRVSRSR